MSLDEGKNDIYGDSKKPVQYVPKVFRSGAEKAAPKPVNDWNVHRNLMHLREAAAACYPPFIPFGIKRSWNDKKATLPSINDSHL